MKKQKLWIDTDIGADVDDAIALSLAVHSPQIELIGVTTVYKNTEERARVTKKLFSYSETDVPVIAGSAHALLAKEKPFAHCLMYGTELEDARFTPDNRAGDAFSGEEAVNAILRAVEQYGSELVLLAIGPMTNVARAIQKAPSVMAQIGKIVIMGGSHFALEQPEWNIYCDPEAAKIVYEAGLPLWCVGVDVTRRTKLPQDVLDAILNLHEDSERGYLADFVRAWVNKRHVGVTLHDPLALYAILVPEWLIFQKQRIFVETKGEVTRGFTVNMDLSGRYSPKEKGKEVYVAADARADEVIRHCMQTVFGIET